MMQEWSGKDFLHRPVNFLRRAPGLRLTGDHFVGKLSATGQPTRLTQPSIPIGWVNV